MWDIQKDGFWWYLNLEVRCGQNQRGIFSSEVIVETLIVDIFSRKQNRIKQKAKNSEFLHFYPGWIKWISQYNIRSAKKRDWNYSGLHAVFSPQYGGKQSTSAMLNSWSQKGHCLSAFLLQHLPWSHKMVAGLPVIMEKLHIGKDNTQKNINQNQKQT